MDTQTHIKEILGEIANVQLQGDIQFKAIFDDQNKRYQIIATGWENSKQVLRTVALLELDQNLIWLHADNTDYDIVKALMKRGVQKEEIVLAFHPPKYRHLSGFATGATT
jgi:hypothetical protein